VRAVLDPNVLISALLSPTGAPAQALRAWQEGRFDLVVSPLVIAELARALAYPKLRRRIEPDDAAAFVTWLSGAAEVVADPPLSSARRSADAGDDYLVALAAAERAALVSGDEHVLALEGELPVFSPRAFLAFVEREQPA
jgi:hypothetical protein